MKYSVDFNECLKDSPKFRASLEDAESDIESLELKLEKLVKLCNIMMDTGKAFNTANSGFINGIRDLASYFHDDSLVSASLSRFAHAMNEMLKYFSILMDQANRCVCKNLNNFIKNDVRKVKEARKHFEKISDDMDNALIRNASAQRSKQPECEEAYNVLTAMKSCFAHTSLDYVFQINVLQSKKRFEVLGTMLSFMHAQNTFFHQGHDLFADLEVYMKDVASQVDELSAKAKVERKEMEERHTLVQQKEVKSTTNQTSTDDEDKIVVTEGYLFKRTTNAFRTWVRRWFTIKEGKLVYRKRSKDSLTIMEEDLRLCTVKPVLETERRFCFEVLSPARSHTLQAESEDECQLWMNAIINNISWAYRDQTRNNNPPEESSEPSVLDPASGVSIPNTQSKPSPRPSKAFISQQLLQIPGNDKCCDCGASDPRWASINLGITLCIECSGIHRSFGVHMSKVRSITLDAWDPEQTKVMMELGNDIINRVYAAKLNDSIAVPATPESNRNIREAWIRAKYVKKAFVNKLPGAKSPSGERIRSWSVKKKIRKSVTTTKQNSREDSESEDVASGLMEAVMSVSSVNKDSDSGLGGSSPDVIVFGTDIQQVAEFSKNLDLDSSEGSATEEEEEGDAKSTTSWEDMSKLDPNILLYKAAEARNLAVMLEALTHGADVNWANKDDEGKTPIMKAVEAGSLTACEYLLLNGAKLDRKDTTGKTPLHHATIHGHTGQVCQFLKRGADLNAKDNSGKDPLTIAVEAANADIVTLLRLSKLNDEMKETEGYFGQTSDETFQDVFKDFSNMASNNPEKLKRK
ncbi:arf-GAP with coiled-coil, ANK repeat and PH domain-containing protein 2 isoform X2 [Patella vulgata]|uniref:arf-GAP with coiled-coil, ANK repeat and PH domain-containing protein 2 isoform X2 n=1 Tax=Patella vulgata TaxID=6465 RepID=UPI002180197F|nr:arf-GAP with coiled-coil, ANK repeat and PH domain-containing protein 2 isoform X2 [Patella vulgata]